MNTYLITWKFYLTFMLLLCLLYMVYIYHTQLYIRGKGIYYTQLYIRHKGINIFGKMPQFGKSACLKKKNQYNFPTDS